MTEQEYTDATSSGRVLVDFWATWCPPCVRTSAILERTDTNGFKVVKVEYDDAKDVAAKCFVRSLPTLIVLQDGVELRRHSGAPSSSERLRAWVLL